MRTIAFVLLLLSSVAATASDDLAKGRALAGAQADYDSLMKAVDLANDVAKTTTNAATLRGDAVAFGLETLDRAAKLNRDPAEVIYQLTYRALLLDAKADITTDAAAKEKLKDEANDLRRRVIEIQKTRRKEKLFANARKKWDVWIIQDGEIVFDIDEVWKLDRRPFSIVVAMPKIEPVMAAFDAGKLHALQVDRTTRGEPNLLEHDVTPNGDAKELSVRVVVGSEERRLTIRFRV